MEKYILAIDQGTTNSRAIIFDRSGALVGHHEIGLKQSFPHDGWVEQDPIDMFENTVTCCRAVFKKTGIAAQLIAAIGITNQRETTILWNKITGLPIYPAIVWQDRRTASFCDELKRQALGSTIQAKTGLLLDPYFSATKLHWLLEHVPGARKQAEQGELLFGTVDTWLLWKLTQGRTHATDVTNASRTLMFNIHKLQWDQDILVTLSIPEILLPAVKENVADFGRTDAALFGVEIPIGGMAGDQQAATIGQACFQPGMMKATYGTGGFIVMNTGNQALQSHSSLLTTIAYCINGKTAYALEGSIFCAGVTVKWLRDQLKLITAANETEILAQQVSNTAGTYLVPAFTGLGAPHWDPAARGALIGMTLNTNRAHIVRAALESVAYQTRDLLTAMTQDGVTDITTIRVDGGMTVNNWFLHFLSDMLNITVEKPRCSETTALGVAYLAGLSVGVYQSLDEIAALWQSAKHYMPTMVNDERAALYAGWEDAVMRVTVKP